MKVWIATATMGVGGMERIIVTLATGLVARGHAVTVSGAPGPLDAELAPLGVERVVLPERGRSATGVAEGVARLARALRRGRPDVVHAHNVRTAAVAGAAARLGLGPRRPRVVATFHGVRRAEYRHSARLLRATDAVACVSADTRDGLAACGFPPARLHVIRNVAPPAPALDAAQRAALEAELGGDGPLVAAVGRLVPEKNHARLLDALALVARQHPTARFAVVGDGPLRTALEAQARRLRLDVRFTGLRLDAPAIIALADLLVFSSDSEGLSIAALEALAAGTPVVSTPVPGMAELLQDGAGVVAASLTAEALAQAIGDVLADPARMAAMGRAGRALADGRWSAAAMVSAYEALYAGLTP